MTGETRKPDGKTNKTEELDFGKSLERDLAQRQSGRERAGKTGEAGREREKWLWEKWEKVYSTLHGARGDHRSMLRTDWSVAETEGRNQDLSG